MSNKMAQKQFVSLPGVANLRQVSREYLDDKYFTVTLIAALMLHLGGLYAWHLMPKQQVVDIPVTALNIKLGDDDPTTAEEMQAIQPHSDNTKAVENIISQMARDSEAPIAPSEKSRINPFDAVAAHAPVAPTHEAPRKPTPARQFVRTTNAPADSSGGSTLGSSSADNAEMVTRYHQQISLWLEKFKLYPDDARAKSIEGEPIVRIRIDRQGNIRYYIIERSSGSEILDRAAIDMVRRANPVPAVPKDYPQDDMLEFLIPVGFHLK